MDARLRGHGGGGDDGDDISTFASLSMYKMDARLCGHDGRLGRRHRLKSVFDIKNALKRVLFVSDNRL